MRLGPIGSGSLLSHVLELIPNGCLPVELRLVSQVFTGEVAGRVPVFTREYDGSGQQGGAWPVCLATRTASCGASRAEAFEPGPALWVLTHVDLRITAGVRIFRGFLVDELEKQRDVIEGRWC